MAPWKPQQRIGLTDLWRVRWDHCPYRLRFIHPFTTNHGTRDGTDAIFLRVQHAGSVGYGEVTLPPYLKEKPAEVIAALPAIFGAMPDDPQRALERIDDWAKAAGPGLRAALHMALIDLIGCIRHSSVDQLLDIHGSKHGVMLVTLGITEPEQMALVLSGLPSAGGLKVKVAGNDLVDYLTCVIHLDNSLLFIDGNQGVSSVEVLEDLVKQIGAGRLLGIEQPFGAGDIERHRQLQARVAVPVYADESVQDLADLEAVGDAFGGVNIKLMKCGGLDRAVKIARRAGEMGMRVMLGSMSESSLGCTAMAALAPMADVVDLDGPWLIANDPFRGIGLEQGRLVRPSGPGLGVRLIGELDWLPS